MTTGGFEEEGARFPGPLSRGERDLTKTSTEQETRSGNDQSQETTVPDLPDAEEVRLSIAWSRRVSGNLFTLLVIAFGALGVSVVGNVILMTLRTPPVYFASTSDGRILPMAPLSDPLRSSRWLLSWTQRVAVDALTFDYVNWKRTFDRIRGRFSPEAFDEFYRATQTTGLTTWIRTNQMVVSAVPEQAPEIVATGVMGGKRVWKIQIPMTVLYTNGSGNTPKHYVVKMTVTRVPETINPNGVEVTQFVMGEG